MCNFVLSVVSIVATHTRTRKYYSQQCDEEREQVNENADTNKNSKVAGTTEELKLKYRIDRRLRKACATRD
jgi:hypothetical protein